MTELRGRTGTPIRTIWQGSAGTAPQLVECFHSICFDLQFTESKPALHHCDWACEIAFAFTWFLIQNIMSRWKRVAVHAGFWNAYLSLRERLLDTLETHWVSWIDPPLIWFLLFECWFRMLECLSWWLVTGNGYCYPMYLTIMCAVTVWVVQWQALQH